MFSHGNNSLDVGRHMARQLVGTDPAQLAVVVAQKNRVLEPAEDVYNVHRIVREAPPRPAAPVRRQVEHPGQAEAHPNNNLCCIQRHGSGCLPQKLSQVRLWKDEGKKMDVNVHGMDALKCAWQ